MSLERDRVAKEDVGTLLKCVSTSRGDAFPNSGANQAGIPWRQKKDPIDCESLTFERKASPINHSVFDTLTLFQKH